MFQKTINKIRGKILFATRLKERIGYLPINHKIYKEALTHRSFQNKTHTHNERLEFLGDAVLNNVVSAFLYNKFPDKTEGFLTKTRAKIVSRKTLSLIGKKLNLQKILIYQKQITAEDLLGNALEALLGAVYVDKGYPVVKTVIIKHLIEPHINIDQLVKQTGSYKSEVLEWAQQKQKKIEFKILKTEGKDHNKTYKVGLLVGGKQASTGSGTSIKRAEEQASKKAYPEIKKRS